MQRGRRLRRGSLVHLQQGRGDLGAEGRELRLLRRRTTSTSARRSASYFPNPPATATEIQAQFKSLGIDLKVHTEDNNTFLTNSNKGQYSLFLLGWGGDYPDMTDWVDYHFGIGAQDAFGKKFTDLTDLLSAGASEVDPAKRLDIYKRSTTSSSSTSR